MRHEDIPPANEYERGVVANRRRRRTPECPQMESKVGGIALVTTFVTKLLDLTLPFTRLRIGSLDDTILVNLQRMPGRVNLYPMTLTDERKEKMEEFCAQKGLEPFTEYLGFEPWSAEPVVGYIFKGSQVAELVTELLTLVYGAKEDREFRFALM
jgi:hypothetical protein